MLVRRRGSTGVWSKSFVQDLRISAGKGASGMMGSASRLLKLGVQYGFYSRNATVDALILSFCTRPSGQLPQPTLQMTTPAALIIGILGHDIRVVDLAGTWPRRPCNQFLLGRATVANEGHPRCSNVEPPVAINLGKLLGSVAVCDRRKSWFSGFRTTGVVIEVQG